MSDKTDHDVKTVLDIIKDARIGMLTTLSAEGPMSRPMATQDTEFDGNLYFITQRSTDLVNEITADPRVNLAYANKGSWASVSGRAVIRDDRAKLKELWGTMTDAWTTGGPENPDNVLLVVECESARYWDSPGAAVMLASMLKAKVTGDQPQAGDSGTVDL